MSTVHIVIDSKPLCGWTSDPPARWPDYHMAVEPEEAHYCNCYACVARLHDRDEREIYS